MAEVNPLNRDYFEYEWINLSSQKDRGWQNGFFGKMILPWLGGSVGCSFVPYTKKVAVPIPSRGTYLGYGFDSWSGCIQEATH